MDLSDILRFSITLPVLRRTQIHGESSRLQTSGVMSAFVALVFFL